MVTHWPMVTGDTQQEPGTFRFRPAFVHDYTTWFYGNNDDVRNFGKLFRRVKTHGLRARTGFVRKLKKDFLP